MNGITLLSALVFLQIFDDGNVFLFIYHVECFFVICPLTTPSNAEASIVQCKTRQRFWKTI